MKDNLISSALVLELIRSVAVVAMTALRSRRTIWVDRILCGPGYDTVAYWENVDPLDVFGDDCEQVISRPLPY